jgi:uncharacterized protein with von Willebrand factor type A (vWA) domain
VSRLLANLVLFVRALRRAGLKVSLEQNLGFVRALGWIDVGERDQVFHAARSLLVSRREDLELFRAVFDRFWLGIEEPGTGRPPAFAPRLDPAKGQRFSFSFMAGRPRPADPGVEVADSAETFSAEEALRRRDFAQLTPEELHEVQRLIRETRWQVCQRRTRRHVPDRRGRRIHLRRALRDAARLDGAPARLRWLRRKVKQRPMVLLADVSGSMESYARLVLQFFYSAAHSLDRVEAFVFGTRLTRITSQLRLRQVDRALDEAAKRVVDWSGGTRIGDSLSDGWERGDVSVLRQEMMRLRRHCYRLIWLNPHLGRAGYEPLVEGMAAALEHVDDFLPIHNLRSLRALARWLARLPARRGGLPAAAGRAASERRQPLAGRQAVSESRLAGPGGAFGGYG